MNTVLRRGLAGGALAAVVVALLPLDIARADTDVTLPVTRMSWVWNGAADHPFGAQYPNNQYVISQNDTAQAETLYLFDTAPLRAAGGVLALTLKVPQSTVQQEGAYDPGRGSAAGTAKPSSIDACPVLADWKAAPAGRPAESTLKWDCAKASATGKLATENGLQVWTFDLLPLVSGWVSGATPSYGIALVATAATGTWSVPLQGKKADVVATVEPAAPTPTGFGPTEVPTVAPTFAPPTAALGGFGSGSARVPSASPLPLPTAAPTPAVAGPPTTPLASAMHARTVPPGVWAGLALLATLLVVAGREVVPRADAIEEAV